MKNIFSVLATISLLLLVSCSKEKSIDSTDPDAPVQPGTGSPTTGSLLVKGVMTEGSDSIVTTYKYDNKGWMIGQTVTSNMANFINVDFDITRQNDGKISAYKYSSAEFEALGVESVNYKLQYDAGKNQYVNKVMAFEAQGIEIKDSTVYIYNAQNQITKTERFLRNPFTLEYLKTTIQEYYYNSGGDMAKSLIYYFDEDQNDFLLFVDNTYEYDDNVNPLQLGAEAIILETDNLYGSHNVKKETVIYPDEPSNNRSLSASFTYNGEKKPVASTVTDDVSGGTFAFNYYYN